ncbi:hypothetical protein OUZ56_002993 [Daphnia magna]|uniref:Ig-like domain-containing protein n=1 Tax=Daphnia magna TaxID=35525 RepID=A0ABR0A7P7_9CRUS|nr:hypothetical protein OUZ56_002993 [Daphnia magna]
MIGYDSNRGGVSVVTEKGIESSSSLLIQNARPADSGKYVCRPDNAEPATVNVHVLNGIRFLNLLTQPTGHEIDASSSYKQCQVVECRAVILIKQGAFFSTWDLADENGQVQANQYRHPEITGTRGRKIVGRGYLLLGLGVRAQETDNCREDRYKHFSTENLE